MPVTEEEEWSYWDQKATELRRGQLATVQGSAGKWLAFLTALLGIFGTVAFAGGLTTIDKLGSGWDIAARTLTTLAALAAVIGIVFLTKAAGGLSVKKVGNLTSVGARDLSTSNISGNLRDLGKGRVAALAASALVLAGSMIVLWVGPAPQGESQKVIAIIDGRAICGELGSSEGRLTIAGEVAETASSLVPVASCGSS
jgi:hypothetical protein